MKAWILLMLALTLPMAAQAEEAKEGEAPKVSYISLSPPFVGNYGLDGTAKLKVYKADIALQVNGDTRQQGSLHDLIWNVADILHELSKLFALKAGDLVFMGTPAGVGPLLPGDAFVASLEGVAELRGRIVPG